jgi:hypothetical protein
LGRNEEEMKKLEIANFDVMCPASLRIQQIEMNDEEFRRRTESCTLGTIVLEQDYLKQSQMTSCICFINRIDGVATQRYRIRLKEGLERLYSWKKDQVEKYEAEIRRIDEEIRKAEEILKEKE